MALMPRVRFDRDLPNLVLDEENRSIGIAVKWNPVGLGECIVQYFDGSASSEIFSELKFMRGPEPARIYLNNKE
jgi:hypothetical protein